MGRIAAAQTALGAGIEAELTEDAQAALRLVVEALRGLDTLSPDEERRVSGLVATMAVARVANGATDPEFAEGVVERLEGLLREWRRKRG
ncbi:MAG: hypothetical protein AAGF51_01375 [Pseudomonadota bacterium]